MKTTMHPRLAKLADQFLDRARARRDEFSPDQERDESGKWTSGGAGKATVETKKIPGGQHEVRRNPFSGLHDATTTVGGKATKVGSFLTPAGAKAAIAKHEAGKSTNPPSVRWPNEQAENAIGEQRAARVNAALTKTYDPTKPYGTTTETRANAGRSYKAQVQNKPEPLRYQGKSTTEKEAQYQKDLTRMREKQAARNAAASDRPAWSRASREVSFETDYERTKRISSAPKSREKAPNLSTWETDRERRKEKP
jgi:hypothetical protein